MGYMTLLEKDNINPWRKTYEINATAAWAVTYVYLLVSTQTNSIGDLGRYALLMVALTMMLWRSYEAWQHLSKKLYLLGSPAEVITSKQFYKKYKSKKGIYLGQGYEWTMDCSQKLYDLQKIGPEKFRLNAVGVFLVRILFGIRTPKRQAMGKFWIHGLGRENEEQQYVSPEQWVGNTMVMGVPGSGKTFMMILLAHQFAIKKQGTIIFDPKDDSSLKNKLAKVAAMTSRPFYCFKLTDPKNSVRINPIGNISSPSDVANRLASLVPSTTAADPFKSQAWLTLSALSEAICYLAEVPTIDQIKNYIDLGWEELFYAVFRKHLISVGIEAENIDKIIESQAEKEDKIAMIVAMYKGLDNSQKKNICNTLIKQQSNPEGWHLKMISGLQVPLQQLTAGEIGPLLSPNPNVDDDERLIIDAEQVIREGGVLYVGLNSLTDKFVSSAIASIFLADYAAVAGRIYSLDKDIGGREVQLLLDEASELVDTGPSGAQGLLQILNKGRGAGYRITAFSQNLSDYTAGLGSKDKAFQIFGNIINKICLRCADPETQEFFVKQFGKSIIKRGSYGINTGSTGNDGDVTNFSGGYRQALTEADAERLTPELLSALPNFEYFGSFGGGNIVKGRFPLVLPD